MDLKSRQFATVFRREAQRTGLVHREVLTGQLSGALGSLEQAAAADVRGYEDWAALAVQRYARARGWPDWPTLAGLASALSRSPMSEVAWAERSLGDGQDVDPDAYDALAAQYAHVRPWPRDSGVLGISLLEWTRRVVDSTGARTEVDLMIGDRPWAIPRDVATDPAYRGGEIPPADLHGREPEWDRDGLWQRVHHELRVLSATYGSVWGPRR